MVRQVSNGSSTAGMGTHMQLPSAKSACEAFG